MHDQKPAKIIVLGITGTISSGKSLVGKILQARGVPVFDTDLITHEQLSSNQAVIKAIKQEFGDTVFDGDKINRKALGAAVFGHPDKKSKLEKIIHPNVIMATRSAIAALDPRQHPVAAILAPMLFEAGVEGEYDEIWATYTKPELLKERLANRDGLSPAQIETRLAAQLPQDEKCRRADQVIDNSGSVEFTEKQVDLLLNKLLDVKSNG